METMTCHVLPHSIQLKGNVPDAVQMVSLTLLLLVSQGAAGAPFEAAALAGVPLLCVASLLTLWSLLDYFRGAWRHLL